MHLSLSFPLLVVRIDVGLGLDFTVHASVHGKVPFYSQGWLLLVLSSTTRPLHNRQKLRLQFAAIGIASGAVTLVHRSWDATNLLAQFLRDIAALQSA
jgi:hypothetical protein